MGFRGHEYPRRTRCWNEDVFASRRFQNGSKGMRTKSGLTVIANVLDGKRVGALITELSSDDEFSSVCRRIDSEVKTWGVHVSQVGFDWFSPGVGYTLYTHVLTPNSAVSDCGLIRTAIPIGRGFSKVLSRR